MLLSFHSADTLDQKKEQYKTKHVLYYESMYFFFMQVIFFLKWDLQSISIIPIYPYFKGEQLYSVYLHFGHSIESKKQSFALNSFTQLSFFLPCRAVCIKWKATLCFKHKLNISHIENCYFSCISHECNYGLEMAICVGAALCGAEGVISTHSCLKAWQIDRCMLPRQIWCWWIYPQPLSPCVVTITVIPLVHVLKLAFTLGSKVVHVRNHFNIAILQYIQRALKIT